MTYHDWFIQHAEKHREIVSRLEYLSDEEVIAYFRYDNMVVHEPDFCPLYAKGTRCHEMEDLNCYLCACPHFRFDDEGIGVEEGAVVKSTCAIDAPGGSRSVHAEVIHHNCSDCTIPHTDRYIRGRFDRDWGKIMKGCEVGSSK